ncbi:MAG: Holliday junction branch migration protein RuvA, partial [Alphaproteobacteria bacterium]|nr:Holliday junction branch migration protein RuvA [Alphaproteobacteria bacterium]
MIAKLTGIIDEILDDSIIIDVHGVGYQVYVTSSLLQKSNIGGDISVQIEHIIKQDAQFLCGFQTKDEIGVFRVLLNVHGIGARSALAILSTLSISEFATAVATQDATPLSRVSGIGKKTAERILLELKDKTLSTLRNVQPQNNENINDAMLG